MPELTLRLDDKDMRRLIDASTRSGYTLDTFMMILLAYSLGEYERHGNFSFSPELAQNIAQRG